jgi:membrane protease YdiL (CAAX protease family)
MIAFPLLLAVPLLMWIVQNVVLMANGMPVRLRIDARRAPTIVRVAGRITTQICLLTVILGYPVLSKRGGILGFYQSLLPIGSDFVDFVRGAAAVVLCLSTLYVIWILTERIDIKAHLSRKRCVRRLSMVIPTALFGAGVEELVFRGVLMGDLFRTGLPPSLAIPVGTIVFAGAHYIRSVKRKWTFPGHLVLGVLLCLAFSLTRNLWLPYGLHAAGIFMIMGTRPFFWYKGPTWITGASIFPFAGLIGISGLGVLIAFVVQHYR